MLNHRPPERNSPRWLRIRERDPAFPRDKDGAPTTTACCWHIDPEAVTTVVSRSLDVRIYLRGVPEPILACEDAPWVLGELGCAHIDLANVDP